MVLADLSFAPDQLLANLPGGAPLIAGRQRLTAAPRPPTEAAALALMGLDPAARAALLPLTTTLGQPGPINPTTAPDPVRQAAPTTAEGPVRALRIGLGE